jgi:hypothetical protein
LPILKKELQEEFDKKLADCNVKINTALNIGQETKNSILNFPGHANEMIKRQLNQVVLN